MKLFHNLMVVVWIVAMFAMMATTGWVTMSMATIIWQDSTLLTCIALVNLLIICATAIFFVWILKTFKFLMRPI